jgi:hypothetical protein
MKSGDDASGVGGASAPQTSAFHLAVITECRRFMARPQVANGETASR